MIFEKTNLFMKNIRNFSIIAHIDHGKSTLSDRLIQTCGGLSDREMEAQVLDSMDLERERGITIKAQSVTLNYQAKDGETYQLNFIDTPGHVDFSYEVSRSLAACEGALLVVDAGQGVEAQTLANCYTAIEMDLEVVPILNKIDLPAADPERVAEEIEDIVGIDAMEAVRCSAKTGVGIEDVLEEIVAKIPAPEGDPDAPLQALIIDSWFDNYLGVVSLARIKNGVLRKGDKIKVMSTGQAYNVDRLGIFTPKQVDTTVLNTGEVGWVVCAIKDILGAPVGDTLTHQHNPASHVLPGFKKVKPQVYAGLFPVSSDTKYINGYEGKNTGLYYSENLTMALLSIDSGKVEKLICNYPLIYQKQKNLVNFKFSLFDTYEKRFLYSYEADSLIYCMNLGDTTITSFGIAGKDMNQNYKQYFTLNDASHNFSKDRNKFGYYHSIVIDPHHDLVFRTYRKGEHSPYDGLQVYQQNCLIADYQTPKNFTFLGYISPWFYASGPLDYDNEQMIIYRFNLNDL